MKINEHYYLSLIMRMPCYQRLFLLVAKSKSMVLKMPKTIDILLAQPNHESVGQSLQSRQCITEWQFIRRIWLLIDQQFEQNF